MKTADEISEWLVSYMAKLAAVDPEQIDTSLPFNSYGIDSTAAAGLSGDLGPSIASYGYGADTVAEWARILATPGASPHGGWLDGPLSALRCLAWP